MRLVRCNISLVPTMKLLTFTAAFLVACIDAAPLASSQGETALMVPQNTIRARDGELNYVQNYNGDVADFSYNEYDGTYSANWDTSTDFVVGLGWSTGAAR